MAALSIPMVVAEGRKINPHLNLFRTSGRFEWVLDDGTTRTVMPVPTDKIRGLKMDQWLVYARALAEGKPVGEIQASAPTASVPDRKDLPPEPMPSFMLIGKGEKAQPFEKNPEDQGYKDGCRGITACPYSLRPQVEAWNRGHDRAFREGKADKQRFSLTAGSRR